MKTTIFRNVTPCRVKLNGIHFYEVPFRVDGKKGAVSKDLLRSFLARMQNGRNFCEEPATPIRSEECS